ncbi:RCC1 domain-containing protein [Adhaeribacter rhizoryzae]|uniref:T9SS type A sorting domain-containing protein n=1 Tax=Adhaeribacter rhizoryzae TaxID=2607907 RepID=A0A5M6DQA2_9BACT|nr:PKD domain-containing protein [Adhaeribacter rhizoryzae]KAA5548360.1 T9SS type A sorting domain-containing protein [Adhaeribacter rhizoryzae]
MKIKFIPISQFLNLNINNTLPSILLSLVCFLTLSQSLFAQSLAQGGGGVSFSSLVVTADGRTFTWGGESDVQLGNGTIGNSTTPIDISAYGDLAGKTIVKIASGRWNSLALDSDGSVYAWGKNSLVGLTSGNNVESDKLPRKVDGLSDIIAIAVGFEHSLALKSDGTVYAWGYSSKGELGNGLTYQNNNPYYPYYYSFYPVQVKDLAGVTAIAAGAWTSYAVKSDGTVYAWGYHTGNLLEDGTYGNSSVPVMVNGINGVTAITAGPDNILALKSDGTVYKWGYLSEVGSNPLAFGRVPEQVPGLTDIIKIASGTYHDLAAKSDGTVYAWGNGSSGQLGDGIVYNGPDVYGSAVPVLVKNLTGVVDIAAGFTHSLAIKGDGKMYAWGNGYNGELGVGTSENSAEPVLVPVSLKPSIATNSLPSNMFYAGQKLNVGFTTDNYKDSDNYSAQLSDATGSFSSPVTIGTSFGWTGNYFQIICTIPANTPPGTGYRIRVINSNPALYGSDNGVNLTVHASPASITWQVLEDFERPNPWSWLPWKGPGDNVPVSGTISTSAAHSGQNGIRDVYWGYRADVAIGNSGDKISMWVKDRASIGFQAHYLETHSFAVGDNKISFNYLPGYLWYPWRELSSKEFEMQPDKWYRIEVTFVGGAVEGRVFDTDGVTELAYLRSSYYYRGTTGIAMSGNYIDDISYYLAPQSSIATSSISGDAFCQGQAIHVPFVVTGLFNSDNTFTAQLSDAEGNFSSPVTIGTITGTASGTISATIPTNTPVGAGYRIRVVSSNPVITGTDNGVNFKVNPAPTLNSITAPITPVQVNAPITTSATFNEINLKNASWAWGDGHTSAGKVNGSVISGNHSYSSPGVYTVSLTIEDACGNTATSEYQYTVVYNPQGYFVTGSGYINSPSGALRGQTEVKGKAIFGFEAKYQKNVATGPGTLQFQVGNFNFKSTSYEESVTTISGNKAYYKGKGTIAGRAGIFGFMVSIIDGQYNGGTGPDRFRIKIYELLAGGKTGKTVYDNLLPTKKGEQADNADLTKDNNTIIGGGSILIQNSTGKKNERVADQVDLGTVASMLTTYPNPFKNKTTIAVSFKQDEEYTLDVYDLKGGFVKHLQVGKAKAGTSIQVTWEPKESVKGVYLIRLVTQNGVQHLRTVKE